MPNRLSKVKPKNKGTMITINLKAHQIEVDGIAKKSKIKNKNHAYVDSDNILIF